MRSPTDSNQAITGTSGGTIKAITKWIDSGCQRHERLKQFQRAFQHELVPPVEADLKQSLTPTIERLLRIWELVEVQENGVRDSFQSQTVPDTFPHNQGIPFLDVELRFEPMPGTDGTLKVTNDNFGRLINQALAVADDPGRPLDPSGYVYTNAEGQEFILDQGFTVREIHEHEGDNRVTFGRDGVVHSAGPSITFVRDAQERIVRVIAPDLSEISYEYDALGNLIAMVDAIVDTHNLGNLWLSHLR